MKKNYFMWIVYLLMLVVTIASASAVNQTTMLNGLVSYWALENLTDETGTYTLTNNGATSGATGIINNAYSFDGTDDYMSANNLATTLYSDNVGTFSLWIKTTDSGDNDNILLGVGQNDTNYDYIMLVLRNDGIRFQGPFGTNAGPNDVQLIAGDLNITDGNWHHIVISSDGVNTNKLYIDGGYVAWDTTSGETNAWFNSLSTSPEYFTIGALKRTSTVLYFDGLIDEVAIFDYNLSNDEVSYLYNSGSPSSAQQYPFPTPSGSSSVSVVTNSTTSGLSFDEVTVYGDLDLGSESSADVFFQYKVNGESNWINTTKTELTTNTTFSETISGLTHNTTYDYRAYAEWNSGANSTSGSTRTFTTSVKPYIMVKDVNGDYLDDFNITIDNSNYVAGVDPVPTIITFEAVSGKAFINETGGEWDVIFSANNWFNKTTYVFPFEVDTSYEIEDVYQALISFNASEIITGTEITNFTVYIDEEVIGLNSEEDFPLELVAGTYDFTFEKTGYFNWTQSTLVSALDNTTHTHDFWDAEINLTVKNAWNNDTLSNFTGWISNEDYSFNQSFTSNDSSIILPLKKDLNYTVFVDNSDFAINETFNYADVFVNESSQNLTLYIYTINSIRINAFEEDASVITQLINVLVTSSAFEQSYNFTNGSTIIEELPDGVYNLRFESSGFTTRSYTVTVASRSTQELSIYLSNSTSEVTFTVQEEGRSTALSEARISMYRFINDNWVTVESKLTDITGKAVLTYMSGERYKFVVSKDNYVSKTFELNPILLSSYTVRLNKRETFPDIPQIFTASVDFTPKRFVQGNNNLTLFFNSPEGRLAEYGFVVSYPGGTDSFDGTNAIGKTHTINFNITGAEFLDTVNLTYHYRLVGGVMQTRSFTLPILDVAPDLSFADLRNNDYGLSTFEKLIIVTLTILLVGGLVLLTAGSVVGGAVVVLLLAWFGFLGFIPVWSLAIVILAGITYLTSKGV